MAKYDESSTALGTRKNYGAPQTLGFVFRLNLRPIIELKKMPYPQPATIRLRMPSSGYYLRALREMRFEIRSLYWYPWK